MASTKEFVNFILQQLELAGTITCRSMFGEYGLYCDGIFFGVICDNQLFIKITEKGKNLLPNGEKAPPYEGAKPYFLITDLDDREFLGHLVEDTCENLPPPKPKKKIKGL